MLLYFAIIGYILSNIVALALLFGGKRMGAGWFRILATIHLILALVFFYRLFTNTEESPKYVSFLLFFCSGIITGGLALGMRIPLVLKIYFGLYCVSIFAFLLSPSMLLNFLVTAKVKPVHDLLPVKGKYFLEVQGSIFQSDSEAVRYKFIQKNGMLHKTIARDLDFHGRLDSIRLISFEDHVGAVLRGYTSAKNFVEERIDSTDVSVDFRKQYNDQIERRL